MKAICITIPKKIKWEDYKKELKAVEDGSQVLNFKVPNLPKDIKNIRRCYLCYDGKIIGWHNIVDMPKMGTLNVQLQANDGKVTLFSVAVCSTT